MPTFTHGKDTRVLQDGYDLSGYLDSASVTKTADVAEVSTFLNSDKQYIAGMKDGTFSAEGFYDRSTAASDPVLQAALAVTTGITTYFPANDAVGATGYGLLGQEVAYDVTSGTDSAVKVTANVQSRVGAEHVTSQHALASRSTAGTATVVDAGASVVNGSNYAGYLHCTAITQGTVTVKIQDSADNVTYTDLVTFTNLTPSSANTAQRVAAAGTAHRYTRCVWNGGTATFAVAFGRDTEL